MATAAPILFGGNQQEHGHDGPTCDPILSIHRAKDSYVTFHRIEGNNMISDCSVRVEAIESVFPQFRAEMERDAFFSLNGFYRPGFVVGRIAGLPRAYRRADGARRLNVCFVDIDRHGAEFDFGALVGSVISLADRGVIPSPSIYERSGRGLWLFWKLVDHPDTDLPPTAHVHRILLWSALQKELCDRLAHIGADRGARDVSRITRVPGSINSKSQTRVIYLFPGSANGRGFSYTMESLAGLLGVAIPTVRPRQPSVGRDRAPSATPNRGYALAAQYRLEDFQLLRELRGCFRDGCRNNAAFVFVWLLRANRIDDKTIEKEAFRLGRECSPPLEDRDIMKAICQGKRSRKMSDETIADKLDVTRQEAERVPRFSSRIPDGVPRVKVTTAERRRAILSIIETTRRVPSCRILVTLLAAKGISAARSSVARDLIRLLKKGKLPQPQRTLPMPVGKVGRM